MRRRERQYQPCVFRRDFGDLHAQYVIPGKEWRYMSNAQRFALGQRISAWLDSQIDVLRRAR